MFRPEFQHLNEIERTRITMPAGVKMRLNRLERPEPWPHGFLERLRVSLAMDQMQAYPAYPPFYDKLARFLGVMPDEIVVGAGIEEHIRTLFMLCIRPGDKVAFLWPTCAMFEIYARAFGAEVTRITVEPGQYFSSAELVEELPADLKLLILANPGQPVNTHYGFGAIDEIAKACAERGAVLALDEAYHGFGASTMIGTHDYHDNLVVLRTFSKAFGAASIRLGYAVGGPKMIGAINAVRQSGEVSAISMQIAGALIDHFDDIVQPGIEAVIEGREVLRDRVMTELGLNAFGNISNHVLIEIGERAGEVADRLAERGILVRARMPGPLDRHLLVTCGSPELMDEFFRELRAAL
jgi:histidinol-phosphate aminotransferase